MNLSAEIKNQIEAWTKPPYDEKTINEIKSLLDKSDERELSDRFYRTLEFGTGGMRGVMGAGINRMNKYVVARATQGLANYLKKLNRPSDSVVIAFDSRHFSDFFARTAAEVLAGNGILVHFFTTPHPTPFLSYAVRHFKASAGILITASHNPPEYNGYKVFFSDGGQILSPHDKGIIQEVERVTCMEEVHWASDEEKKEFIVTYQDEMDDAYLKTVLSYLDQGVFNQAGNKLKVVYTPLYGTGRDFVQGLLRDKLALDFHMVEEQASFDGDFPTVSSPNPEDTEALDMAVQKAVSLKADLVMGTDPDSDRLGVIIRHQGEYLMLNGNQLGIIMLGYLLKNRNLEGKKHYVVSTIVSSDMVIPMCEKASLDLYITLTGFKYIGGILTDKEGDADHFLFGFEESYGYLNGDYIRDKDGVSAAGLVCEVAQALKDEGKTLMDYLEELFLQYGYYRESLSSFTLKGQEGNQKIEQIINYFREQVQTELFGMPVLKKLDLKLEQKWEQGALEPFHDFPKSNVLVFYLAPHFKLAVRPSGTEPKIKLYFGINNYQNRPVSQIILKNELQNFENSILEGVKKLLS